MMRVRLSGFALPLLILVAMAATGIGGPVTPPRSASVDVHFGETIVTFPAVAAANEVESGPLGAVVALPHDASFIEAVLLSGSAGEVRLADQQSRMRGRPVAVIEVSEPGDGAITIAVRHDGDWAAKSDSRLASPALDAVLAGARGPAGLKAAGAALGGSYVIISGPQYASALAPLVDWKTRKGWPVTHVTTDETGTANEAIRAWLQVAYDTWDYPPEYVLLVGDVDAIPSWSFSGNVTDMPYALLDGDDWLPDVMLGRFSVSNQTECAALVAKSVHYEISPYVDQTEWFTRAIGVAGQYASTTPHYTVKYCLEQLETIGFDPVEPVGPIGFGDPYTYSEGNFIVSGNNVLSQFGYGVRQNEGPLVILPEIDNGCSLVIYRGWAYGTAGWEPPHFTVDEVPGLANGAMTPIVMSFVCLNGDFSAAATCFGEVFTRVGGTTPETFKGAVAFIGNGEHWSHTRFNDAMAIAMYERIVEPDVTTLGGLLNAGKLRFMEYYPGELDDTGDEESVEFYFHIYNLLGDPELNFHRTVPTALTATHVTDLAVGTTLVEVTAFAADGTTPAPDARVGIAQAGQWLGAAISGADGVARTVLSTPVGNGPVDITVSQSGRIPYTAVVNGNQQGVYLGLTDLAVDDTAPGNGDGVPNPAESLTLTPMFRNSGTEGSGSATVTITVDGPAEVTTGSALLDPLAAGAAGATATPLEIAISPDAEDGSLVNGRLAVERGGEIDLSGFTLLVAAPELHLAVASTAGDTWLESGTTTDLTVTLSNNGSFDTGGGTLALSLTELAGATLLTDDLTFGAVGAGEVTTCGPLSIQLDSQVAAGQAVNLQATATCNEGAVRVTSVAIPVGRGTGDQPAGPDNYGYYAYDSADYLYPDQRPVYSWREISTAFGGEGTLLPFTTDNYNTNITVDLPFAFTYYGESFEQIRVADNGWISFEATNRDYNFYNWPIPTTHGNAAVVAPFWDNLTPVPLDDDESGPDPVGIDSDGVYWLYDEAAGEFVVEWSRMRHYKPAITDMHTFQLVLRNPTVHETESGNGEILFFYKQVADNDDLRMYATVGIESPDEAQGLQLTYDSVRCQGTMPLGPGQAVRLTTEAPVRVPLAVTNLVRQDEGEITRLTWHLDDERPVQGWRVYALVDGAKTCLTDAPLPANARSLELANADQDLVLEAILPHGGTSEVGTAAVANTIAKFALGQSLPNPVRGETSVSFSLPQTGAVKLRVFDVRGRLVRTLIDGQADSGRGVVVWQGRDDSGRDLADGVYFYRLEHGGQSLTQKLLLVR